MRWWVTKWVVASDRAVPAVRISKLAITAMGRVRMSLGISRRLRVAREKTGGGLVSQGLFPNVAAQWETILHNRELSNDSAQGYLRYLGKRDCRIDFSCECWFSVGGVDSPVLVNTNFSRNKRSTRNHDYVGVYVNQL